MTPQIIIILASSFKYPKPNKKNLAYKVASPIIKGRNAKIRNTAIVVSIIGILTGLDLLLGVRGINALKKVLDKAIDIIQPVKPINQIG